MAGVFDTVAERLEAATDLGRLEARGTIRLALRAAGLELSTVTTAQMAVVLDKVLPGELAIRGVSEPALVCAELGAGLAKLAPAQTDQANSPEAVFTRLGGA